MVRYPGLARFNYLQSGKYLLVCILRRNPGGGGVVKLPKLNSYDLFIGVVQANVGQNLLNSNI
jgi:hypothetical protein